MGKQVVGIGAGGHAKVVIEILRAGGHYDVVGLLDPNPELKGKSVAEVPVLGDDTILSKLIAQGIRHFFIGVGSVGDASIRKRFYEFAVSAGMEPVMSIHHSAIISPSVRMGQGNMIMAGVVINASSTLGSNVIVNTGSIVDHDCWLGDHAHVATGAKLSGKVRVGTGAHIGSGAVIRHNINIGDNAVVGTGAAVVKDVNQNDVVVGVPARVMLRASYKVKSTNTL